MGKKIFTILTSKIVFIFTCDLKFSNLPYLVHNLPGEGGLYPAHIVAFLNVKKLEQFL